MSVKRKDLIKYLEEHGFYLLREGSKHSIYTNDEKEKTIPVKSNTVHLVCVCGFNFAN